MPFVYQPLKKMLNFEMSPSTKPSPDKAHIIQKFIFANKPPGTYSMIYGIVTNSKVVQLLSTVLAVRGILSYPVIFHYRWLNNNAIV